MTSPVQSFSLPLQGDGTVVSKKSALLLLLSIVTLTLFLSGCQTSESTFITASEQANQVKDLYLILSWVALAVMVVVLGVLLYAVIRFRARPGQGDPEQVHGNTPLEIGWTVAFAVILGLILAATYVVINDLSKSPPAEALEVKVIGHQWWWEFRYPDLKVVTANELHLESDRPVNFSLESVDLVHSFWIPQLTGKIDVFPAGRVNSIWFTPTAPGVYQGKCAEYCGSAHAHMRFKVIVHPQEEFEAWVRSERETPVLPLEAQEGELLFARKVFPVLRGEGLPAVIGCASCHTVKPGSAFSGVIAAPNLAHVGSRITIAAGTLERNQENIENWLRDPQAIKPGNRMPKLKLTDQEITALAVYLNNLK